MKKLIFIIICTTLFKNSFFGQGGFSKNYFPTNSLVSVCNDIIEAPNENLIMTGFTLDTLTGTNKLTLISADKYGIELWRKDYGTDKFEYLDTYNLYSRSLIKGNNCFYYYGAVRDSNNKYLSVFIKFTYNGDSLWQKKYYDANDYLYIESVTKSVDNGFLMTGLCDSPTNETCLLIKTDSTGNELWRKKLHKNVPDIQSGSSIIQDSLTKKIIIAGCQSNGSASAFIPQATIIVTDSLGNQLQRHIYSGGCTSNFRDLIQTRDKKCIAVGDVDQCNNLGGPNGSIRNKGWMIKFDFNDFNNTQWTKVFDTLSIYNSIVTINELQNGDLILGGYLDTLSNYYINDKEMLRLIKTDKNGVVKWNKKFSRDNAYQNSKYIRSLNVTSSGSYLTANDLYYAASPKAYSITKIDSMGCDSTVAYCQSIGVGLENTVLSSDQFKIYPNPANDVLNIKLDVNSMGFTKVEIINSLGQLVSEEEIILKNKTASIKTSELPNGIYLINLKSGNSVTVSKRFVIAR